MSTALKPNGLAVLVLVLAFGIAGWTVWHATLRSDMPGIARTACDDAGRHYREVAARPIPQLPELPVLAAPTTEERQAFRQATEERSAMFAERGAALHDYARACNVGSYGQEEGP
jgi:hypothetical protein